MNLKMELSAETPFLRDDIKILKVRNGKAVSQALSNLPPRTKTEPLVTPASRSRLLASKCRLLKFNVSSFQSSEWSRQTLEEELKIINRGVFKSLGGGQFTV